MSAWFKIRFSAPGNIETLGYELCALGAQGTELLSDELIEAYLDGAKLSVEPFLAKVRESLGDEISLVQAQELQKENWVAKCRELWTPIEIGDFLVSPDPQSSSDYIHLHIEPGLGFGTGHHPCTKMLLAFLSEQQQDFQSQNRFLDFGTGSGILAIAAQRLLGMPGEATDIDPLALQNAEENSGRNHTTEQIHFSNSSVETFPSEHFHLLLANVYAEVLVEMEAEFFRVLRKGGHIFLSGIMASKEEMVLSSYSSPRWVHKESRREGNWWALRFQK